MTKWFDEGHTMMKGNCKKSHGTIPDSDVCIAKRITKDTEDFFAEDSITNII